MVLYVSDHGELAGQHGIWQKQCFYEASVRVPMILRTPHGAAGQRSDANVSLVDVLPTLLDLAGLRLPSGLPGTSLARLRSGTGAAERAVFSEYHAQGMLEGGFMIKRGDYKYNYYVGHDPQLFDLHEDPGEFTDLAADPRHAPVRADLHRELLAIADPERISAQALRDQQERHRRK